LFGGLGNISNNIVEAYALWERVFITIDKRVINIVILGDSIMVVRVIIKRTMIKNNASNSIISRIFSLLVEFDKVKIFHIKREINSRANYWPKLGSRMDEGLISINMISGVLPIP